MSNTPVTIVYDGAPQAKGRARIGKGRRPYTPAATRQFQHDFGWCAKGAMAGRRPFVGAVTIAALFEIEIPKSWTATRRASAIAGTVRPTTKPDIDNLLKAVLDALNGIVVADDVQVVEVAAKKIYGSPKAVVTVTPLHNGVRPAMPTAPDDLRRLFDELHAAPTRAEAIALFENADWVFLRMDPMERERAYERISDIVAEKGDVAPNP